MSETWITRLAERHPMFGLWLILAAFLVGAWIDTGSFWQ